MSSIFRTRRKGTRHELPAMSGTTIDAALAYCEQQIEHPTKTHLVLIADLYEGGDAKAMLARVAAVT